ncbi:uncharacterized protein LOC132268594 [Cornus florida]|uniref:uncharacterized protein LOC132268594 n=1 Tax=Cornus florida TaxID=4283 RepID=UPI00289A731B|nr:uncharacterized protein LOC132268594 [Cornus florida]
MSFLLESWEVVRQEIMGTFHEFHPTGKFEKSLNASFIALIPKKGGAYDIKDFRPISLIECCISSLPRLRSGAPGVLCKLDIEKAYDHVCWNFLFYLLERMGFCERWRNWIVTYVSSVRFSVLVNGSPFWFFGSSRGLRRGDPFSPFLFIIVMEALSRLMRRAVSLGLIRGFKIGLETVHQLEISHLLFADDTLVFCEADESQLRYLRCVLVCFQAVSGLRTNVGKSVLVPVGEVQEVNSLVAVLGCKTSSFPISYLGLPLGVSSRRVGCWYPVVERFERRRLEMIQRNFLWGGRGEEFKYRLVRWEQVCKPLKSGGLGIRRLAAFNRALLGKWLWRFGSERHRLWRKIVACRFGEDIGGWSAQQARSAIGVGVGVGVWQSIGKGWDEFSKHIIFRVREGRSVRFWEDPWYEERPLCHQFPRLFRIAVDCYALVADCYCLDSGGGWYWGGPFELGAFFAADFSGPVFLLLFVRFSNPFLSMEDGLAFEGSSYGGFFCLDCCLGQDPNSGQFEEDETCHCLSVLSVGLCLGLHRVLLISGGDKGWGLEFAISGGRLPFVGEELSIGALKYSIICSLFCSGMGRDFSSVEELMDFLGSLDP